MIDLHCHILPGLDDGPGTVEDAVALARAAVTAGTSTVVATPHVSGRYPAVTSAAVAAATAELSRRLRDEGVPLGVLWGAEVAVLRAAELDDEELRRLRLGTGPWLLAECPTTATSDVFEFQLRSLADRGFRVLLAHPERIAAFQRDRRLLVQMVDAGMRCQLTAGSLAGRFGRTVQRFAWSLAVDGLVHVVASDAHGVSRRRPEIHAHLEQQWIAAEWVTWWTSVVPNAVLSGDTLPPPPSSPLVLAGQSQRSPRRLINAYLRRH